MKNTLQLLIGFILIISFLSCHNVKNKKQPKNIFDSLVIASYRADSITALAIVVNNSSDINPADFTSLYVVVIDTNTSYNFLHEKMFSLENSLHLGIDTLGRCYNTGKNLIALPDSAEDESYAGSYFPRRFPSTNLSLEYLDAYTSVAGKKTIALVSGIFEKKEKADSSLMIIRQTSPTAFDFPALIYEGKIH